MEFRGSAREQRLRRRLEEVQSCCQNPEEVMKRQERRKKEAHKKRVEKTLADAKSAVGRHAYHAARVVFANAIDPGQLTRHKLAILKQTQVIGQDVNLHAKGESLWAAFAPFFRATDACRLPACARAQRSC